MGALGLRTARRAKVPGVTYHTYVASGGRHIHTKRWTCRWL